MVNLHPELHAVRPGRRDAGRDDVREIHRHLVIDLESKSGAVHHHHQRVADRHQDLPRCLCRHPQPDACPAPRACSANWPSSLNPTLPPAAADALIAGQIQQAYLKNKIADAASSAADIVRQNAVINAIDDAGRLAGQRTNDPAAMVLAIGRAQATAQQNATWLNNGKVAEQALPVFRNVVEALTYALFPLMVLMLLVTSGRETLLAFKGYATVLIWIQLWPPLYAVLNYMATVYAAYDLAAAANPGTGVSGLTLQTSSTIYSRAISGEAVVGYLAISIPFLAWAALKRMESMGTAMVGGLSGLQSAIGAGTGSAATRQREPRQCLDGPVAVGAEPDVGVHGEFSARPDGEYVLSSNALTGRTAVSMLRNQGFASRVVSMRVSEQDMQDASRQVDAARSEAVAASTERSAVLAEVFSKESDQDASRRRAAVAPRRAASSSWGRRSIGWIRSAKRLKVNRPDAGAGRKDRPGRDWSCRIRCARCGRPLERQRGQDVL